MAEEATISLDQTSEHPLHLKLVSKPNAKEDMRQSHRPAPTRLEAADDVEDMWDNVPV